MLNMKILHVVEAFGGGAFQSVCLCVNTLASVADNEVYLAYSKREQTPTDFEKHLDPKVTLIELKNFTREISPVKDLLALLELMEVLRKIRPDILHLHSSKAGFIGRAAARLKGISKRTFYSPRGFAFLNASSKLKSLIYKTLEIVGSRVLGGTVVGCSKDEAQIALGLKFKAVCIENALNTSILSIKAPHENLNSNTIRVLSSGRICEQKRPEFFSEVAQLVKSKISPQAVEFVWAGKDVANYNFSSAVDFVREWIPQKEMISEMEKCDIYIQASAFEGMPIAVMQAQYMGKCVMVANTPGNTSAVEHNVTGIVEELVAQKFSATLIKLIKDKALRDKLGSQAQEKAKRVYHEDRLLEDLMKLYRSSL